MRTVRAVTNSGPHADGPRRTSRTWSDDDIYVTGTKADPSRHTLLTTLAETVHTGELKSKSGALKALLKA